MARIAWLVVMMVAGVDSAVAQTRELRLGIVHREAASGHRMVAGIQSALEGHADSSGGMAVVPYVYSYPYEEAGLRAFREVIQSDSVDVVLGPTDTGVFLDLLEFGDVLDSARLPIISPLVTADVGNERDGWLFRTNVKVSVRANRIHSELTSRGVKTIAVLYEATGFGDSAETALRNLLTVRQQRAYLPLRYADPAEIAAAVRRVEEERPSAVGLFGSREHLETLGRALSDAQYGLVPYDPLVFTIIDASTLCLDGVLFVSLSRRRSVECDVNPREMEDELTDLGYDTAVHLLRVAAEVPGDPRRSDWRSQFRDRLVASLRAPGQPLPRTGMIFSGMENLAPPAVRVFGDGSIRTTDHAVGGWRAWLQSRLDVRRRRFGLMPWVNLSLVLGLVAGLTFFDVRKSYTGSWLRFVWRWTFLRLVLFNVSVAGAVFVGMVEFGEVRWDNTVVALSVAFGYTMLLKATIFETRTGQAVGLAQLYDRVLEGINRRLMVMRYELEGPRVYYLSYTNSRSWLKQVLRRVYRESEEPDRAKELLAEADAEADAEPTEILKRRVYARILLDLMSWHQIVRSRLVPPGMTEDELFDPASLLREAAAYSTRRPENIATVKAMVDKALENLRELSATAHDEAKELLDARIARSTSERGRVYVRLEWLVEQQALSIDQIRSKGLVGETFDPVERRGGRGRRMLAGLRRLVGARNRPPAAEGRPAAGDAMNALPGDRARERRRTRRVLASGDAMIVRDTQDASGRPWQGTLADIGRGGAGVVVAPDATVPDGPVVVTIRSGPLAGLASAAECLAARDGDGGTRLSMKWVDPPEDATRQIVEYVCAPPVGALPSAP